MFFVVRFVVGVLATMAGAVAVAFGAGRALPAGPEIAYVSRPGGDAEIFLMDVDRVLSVNLTNTNTWWPGIPGAQDQSPAWSPDGEWLAFQSTRGGNDDIWLMDARGGNLLQLTQQRAMDMHPEWSPDGCCIVYQAWHENDFEIFMLDVEAAKRGEPPIQLTDNSAGDRHPAFHPDGDHIIYASSEGNPFGAFELFTMNLDGSERRQLSAVREDFNALHPSYSPDGAYIIYDTFGDNTVSNIYMMRTEGVRTPNRVLGEPLARDNADAYFPTLSPDGKYVLYVTSRERNNSEIFIVEIEGEFELGTPRQLTNDPVIDIHPVMRPPERTTANNNLTAP